VVISRGLEGVGPRHRVFGLSIGQLTLGELCSLLPLFRKGDI
jgi:hypothetical protein